MLALGAVDDEECHENNSNLHSNAYDEECHENNSNLHSNAYDEECRENNSTMTHVRKIPLSCEKFHFLENYSTV